MRCLYNTQNFEQKYLYLNFVLIYFVSKKEVLNVISNLHVFLLKGGAYVVSLMDRYAAGYSILFAVFFESLVLSWAYGMPWLFYNKKQWLFYNKSLFSIVQYFIVRILSILKTHIKLVLLTHADNKPTHWTFLVLMHINHALFSLVPTHFRK